MCGNSNAVDLWRTRTEHRIRIRSGVPQARTLRSALGHGLNGGGRGWLGDG
jgi:hypothetical protein